MDMSLNADGTFSYRWMTDLDRDTGKSKDAQGTWSRSGDDTIALIQTNGQTGGNYRVIEGCDLPCKTLRIVPGKSLHWVGGAESNFMDPMPGVQQAVDTMYFVSSSEPTISEALEVDLAKVEAMSAEEKAVAMAAETSAEMEPTTEMRPQERSKSAGGMYVKRTLKHRFLKGGEYQLDDEESVMRDMECNRYSKGVWSFSADSSSVNVTLPPAEYCDPRFAPVETSKEASYPVDADGIVRPFGDETPGFAKWNENGEDFKYSVHYYE